VRVSGKWVAVNATIIECGGICMTWCNCAIKLCNDNYIKYCGNKIRATWNVINRECKVGGKKDSCISEIIVDGRIVKDKLEIANLINIHFVGNIKND
jgi:hypothetical protein